MGGKTVRFDQSPGVLKGKAFPLVRRTFVSGKLPIVTKYRKMLQRSYTLITLSAQLLTGFFIFDKLLFGGNE